MALKDIVLSARVAGSVMNYPLYDYNLSESARRSIADGKLSDALAEYHRLAAMGSARAKCVLAYLSLRNLPGAPRKVETAKLFANAALSHEPGYANYVLSYVASFERRPNDAVNRMVDSYKAKFIPAASALGLILAQGYGVSKNPKDAETFFWRAISAGHIPAPMLLCRFYVRGSRGVAKRLFGAVLFPLAWLYAVIASKFGIFSIRTFRHFNVEVPPMFNESALTPSITFESPGNANAGAIYDQLNRQALLVRWTHLCLGVVAAAVYQTQNGFWAFRYWRSRGFAVIACLALPAWPYLASGVGVWRRATIHVARPRILCLVLIIATSLISVWYSNAEYRKFGLLGDFAATSLEFLVFLLARLWAYEDSVDD